MRDRIYLVPPPTSLDAHSIARSNYHAPSCPCSHRISTPSTPGLRQEPPIASTRRHLAVQTVFGGSGISTRCPSPTAFALGLGPTNPEMITMAQETLLLRPTGFSPVLWLLIPAFSLDTAPPNLAVRLRCNINAPLPRKYDESYSHPCLR